jgi:3-oxoadipate enol-lactonase
VPKLNRNGMALAWSERGAGPPVLLIMGHRYSSRMWYPLVEGLGDRYRLISFDNCGTGESGDRAETSIAELTADALAVLDAAGVEKAHIYGVSMGGGIALEFGLRYPERVRSLILGCTTAKTEVDASRPMWLMKLIYHLPMPLINALRSKRFKNGYGDAAPDDAIARDEQVLASDRFTRRGVWAQAKAIHNYAVDPAEVRALKTPTLVLHGTQDLAVPYEAGKTLAGLIPGARLVTFEGCGHNYLVAAGEKATAEVDRFIQSVEAANPHHESART